MNSFDFGAVSVGIAFGGCLTIMVMTIGLMVRAALSRKTKVEQFDRVLADDIEDSFPISNASEVYHCVVCLTTVETGERVRSLSCGHAFHPDCISAWWLRGAEPCTSLRSLTCPMCRQKPRVTPPQPHLKTRLAAANERATEVIGFTHCMPPRLGPPYTIFYHNCSLS